jgi:DNA-binding GntR family transcriptional regulator
VEPGGPDGKTEATYQVSGRPLHEDVRHYLHEAIVQGRFKPGGRIVESRLARELGVSQAPVREALRELEQMGLVVHHPRRGATVRQITATDAREMYTLRAHLESMAARLALERLTEQDFERMDRMIREMVEAGENKDHQLLTRLDTSFHEFLCERSGHGLLLKVWRGNNPLVWTMITVITLERHDLVELAERHRPILNALRSGDPDAVDRAIRDHVLLLGEEVTRHLEEAGQSGSETEEEGP